MLSLDNAPIWRCDVLRKRGARELLSELLSELLRLLEATYRQRNET